MALPSLSERTSSLVSRGLFLPRARARIISRALFSVLVVGVLFSSLSFVLRRRRRTKHNQSRIKARARFFFCVRLARIREITVWIETFFPYLSLEKFLSLLFISFIRTNQRESFRLSFVSLAVSTERERSREEVAFRPLFFLCARKETALPAMMMMMMIRD